MNKANDKIISNLYEAYKLCETNDEAVSYFTSAILTAISHKTDDPDERFKLALDAAGSMVSACISHEAARAKEKKAQAEREPVNNND